MGVRFVTSGVLLLLPVEIARDRLAGAAARDSIHVPPLLPFFEITNFTQIGTFPTGGGAHKFES